MAASGVCCVILILVLILDWLRTNKLSLNYQSLNLACLRPNENLMGISYITITLNRFILERLNL